METQSNPAWSNAIIERFCDTIKAASKKYDLPEPLLNSKCRISKRDELGAGAYGIVFNTTEDDCVFKITADSSEAHFAATAIKLRREKGVDPKGIVDLRAVYAVPAKRDDFDVFFLWREKAKEVGLPSKPKDCDIKQFLKLLNSFYSASDDAFKIAFDEQRSNDDYFGWLKDRVDLANAMLDGKAVKYQSKFSNLLVDCYEIADDMMDAGGSSYLVGEALRTYLYNGILLCDMHADNVGIVDRGGCGNQDLWCIVDAGHSLVLKKSLSQIEIPVLKEI